MWKMLQITLAFMAKQSLLHGHDHSTENGAYMGKRIKFWDMAPCAYLCQVKPYPLIF
jgi:hypothetical protein